jgi:predicted transcriptional regulator
MDVDLVINRFMNKKASETNIISKDKHIDTIEETKTLQEAVQKVKDLDLSLIVVDDKGKAKKLLAPADALTCVSPKASLDPKSTLARQDFGNTNFDYVTPDSTMREVFEKFKKTGHSYLIVLSDQKEFVGKITKDDYIKALQEFKQSI